MRMNGKRWALVSVAAVAAAIGAFAVGVVSGQVADSAEGKSFAARVAEILDPDEEIVQDAMTEAQRDMREEAVKTRLDELVASGDMTQDEVDEYMT